MKILWVSPWFGNYRIPLYGELNKLSNGNFYLICSKDNLRDLVIEKVKNTLGDNAIIMCGEKKIGFGNGVSDFANSSLIIKRQPGLYAEIKRINPDIIVCIGFGGWAPVAMQYAILHRKKLCMVYERTKYVERNSPLWRTNWRRIVGRTADLFFVNGKLCEEYLNDVLWFKHTPKISGCMVADSHELSNSVSSVDKDEIKQLCEKLNLGSGLSYLFVGQLVERKGIRELLSVWRKHIDKYPDDNLIVVGSGVLKEVLVAEYGNTRGVYILGGIPYDQIHMYYAICDVFVMPTLEDNWCLVVPEAMACGKPIACSIYNGGHLELVKEGVNGYNFDPLDHENMLEALSKFHRSDLRLMGSASVVIEKDFWPEVAALKMYTAMQKLVSKP